MAACQQPGVSIAAVALARGLNANLLRRWVVEAERTASGRLRQVRQRRALQSRATHGFVPVALSSDA